MKLVKIRSNMLCYTYAKIRQLFYQEIKISRRVKNIKNNIQQVILESLGEKKLWAYIYNSREIF